MTVMRSIILSSLIALLFISVGCQKDDEVDYYTATTLSLSTTKFSELDANFVAVVKSTAIEVSEVRFTLMDGTLLATVPLVDGQGNVSIASNLLAIPAAGKSVVVKMIAMVGGNEVQARATIALYSPFTVTTPAILEEGTLKPKYVFFSEATSGSTISTISLTRTVSKFGTPYVYTNTFKAKRDSISIVPSDYNLQDTLYFVLSATAGTITKTKSFSVIIKENLFPAASSINLNSVSDSIYNLVNGARIVKDTVEISDLVYQSLLPGTVGFKSFSAMSFVKITGYDFDKANFVTAKGLYDAGISVTSVSNAVADDLYAFKVTRPIVKGGVAVTFYGVIKVVATHFAIDNGVETSTLDIDYVVKELY